MNLFLIITILVCITAGFAYFNSRFLKLPDSIGMMLASLVFSVLLISFGTLFPSIFRIAQGFIAQIDFGAVLLEIMLSFLLFAGALHTDLEPW